MCSISKASSRSMSSFHSSSVSLGKPNIRSTDMFLIPIPLRRLTAFFTSSAVCLRCKKCKRSSEKVCAPIEIRLIGRERKFCANSSVTSSGLHSIVISIGIAVEQVLSSLFHSKPMWYTLSIVWNIFCKLLKESSEGVPPPK